jgi:hypothetical protein
MHASNHRIFFTSPGGRWSRYSQRRSSMTTDGRRTTTGAGETTTGGRCTTGAGATTAGRGAGTTATGTGSSKPTETWTSPACVDHGTTSVSRLRPRKVKILPFRITVCLCYVAISSGVHGLIHDYFYAKIEQRSCHALCLSWSRLQCVAGAFAPSPWPGQVGIGGSKGEIGTAGLCRPSSTPRCTEMPTLQWSSVESFGFAKEGVSRLLHDVSEELSVIK